MTAQEPAATAVQGCNMQHTDVWVGGVVYRRRSPPGTKRRQLSDGERHHREDTAPGGLGEVADLRSRRLDKGAAPTVAGAHSAHHGQRTVTKARGVHHVQASAGGGPTHGWTGEEVVTGTGHVGHGQRKVARESESDESVEGEDRNGFTQGRGRVDVIHRQLMIEARAVGRSHSPRVEGPRVVTVSQVPSKCPCPRPRP